MALPQGLTAYNDSSSQVKLEILPLTGGNTKISAPYDWLILCNKQTTIASYTITLPTTDPDGKNYRISTLGTVTSFNFSPAVNGFTNGTILPPGEYRVTFSANLGWIIGLTLGGGGSGAVAAITSGTIDGAVIGGTTPAAITGTNVNYTIALEQSGVPVMSFGSTAFGSGTQATNIGPFAGQNNTGSLNTFVGFAAGQSNTTGVELVFVGDLAGQMHTTGSYNTAVGEHALGYDPAPIANTAIGNDSMRNRVTTPGNGFNVGVGKNTCGYGRGFNHTAIGTGAYTGNGSVILFTGTPTVGDVINLVWTGTFVGSPHTTSFTVSTATLGAIATSYSTLINADSTLLPLNNGGGLTIVQDTSNLFVAFIGTGTTGQSVTIAPSVTGTTVCTVTNGENGFNNIAIGTNAIQGAYVSSGNLNVGIGTGTLYRLTSGAANIAIGSLTSQSITSGSFNNVFGYQAGLNLTTGTRNVGIGDNSLNGVAAGSYNIAIGSGAMSAMPNVTTQPNNANIAIGPNSLVGSTGNAFSNVGLGSQTGKVITTGNQNTLIGSNNSQAITTGANNLILGQSVASVTLTTGNRNIILGVDATADTAATSTSDTVLIKGIGTAVLSSTATNTTPTTILGGITGTSVTTGLTAHSGGGQASALALTTSYNNVTVVAAAADSVRLPVTTIPGISVAITNSAAVNSLQVYGAGTDTINGVATGTGVAIAAGKTAIYYAPASGVWFGGVLT